MTFWNTLFGLINGGEGTTGDSGLPVPPEPPMTNPATHLPMLDGIGGVDVSGSPYGTDIHHIDISPEVDPFG